MRMITKSQNISEHFHSSEFVCQHCGEIKIDENLVNKMENIFSKLRASKCIISSGYRCPEYDIQIGGFAGRHSEGLAADCVYYDKNGKMIPSKIVCCVAYDLGELNGIAKIDEYYVHLDNRANGYYHGDEARGNDNYWENPYDYFGVSKEEVSKYTGDKPKSKPKTINLGDTVIVNGVGTASSTGEGDRTINYVNQEMKVIMIASNTSRPNRYALNQYNKGVVNDPFSVTAWFSINDIKKV